MNNKVCILTSVHPPFDARVFYREAKTLAESGYIVTLIAQHDKVEVVDDIKIIPLSKPKNRFFRFFITVWAIFFLAKKQKADVYHFHDPELILVGVLLKVFLKAKIIYDVHEDYPGVILHKSWIPRYLTPIVSALFCLVERISCNFFDYIVCANSIIEKRYKGMKVRSECIENYPLTRLSKTYMKNPQKNIIYIGGISKIRGICELLHAVSIVIEKYPGWTLYLVGSIATEQFAAEIDKLINELDIKENVKLVSWVPYEEKEKYLAAASISIVTYLPYANNISGLPNKLFDYMLIGLPVVASNFPLYKEIVEKNKCGVCVDPTKPEEIAQAIGYLIEHPEETRIMGANGEKAVFDKYNWENVSKILLNIYEDIKKN